MIENENTNNTLYPETQGSFGGVPAEAMPEQEVQEVVQPEVEAAPQQPRQEIDDRERNLARLREARERAEYERDEAIRYIQQMEAKKNQPVEEEDVVNWESDEFVEAKAVNRKLKNLENKLRQYETQTAYQVTEARLKSQFQDFDRVVNNESVAALRASYPEIAESLHQTPDLYNKAVSTYNIIKKFGLAESEKNLVDKAQVARNAAKPKATNSISPQAGDSPLNKANDFANGFLSEDRKAQLWQEIQAARRTS